MQPLKEKNEAWDEGGDLSILKSLLLGTVHLVTLIFVTLGSVEVLF